MIRIRLRRIGKKRHPHYRVVVVDQPSRRDGRFIETLGSYDPHQDPPSLIIDGDKAKDWITKGAQPSEAAEKLLVRAGVIEKKKPFPKVKLEAKRAEQAKAAETRAAERAKAQAKAEAEAAKAAEAEAKAAAEAEAAAPAEAATAEDEKPAEE
ncbi:MAG TPA: 30S ribosomal protein S16 [Tepidiformaceae bacterium]|nr:30S ribosomal protein S16 [Tepidiformaceae bacterium]